MAFLEMAIGVFENNNKRKEVIKNEKDIIFEYLSDGKIFQPEAENSAKQAIEKLIKENPEDILDKLNKAKEAIINFSGHKIRLMQNLSNEELCEEIISQLNTELNKFFEALNIDPNEKKDSSN